MNKLLKYFTHIKLADRLPPIPRMYASDYDTRALSDEELKLMKMSAIRSPQGIHILKRRKQAATAGALIDMLPTTHKPRRGARLMPLMRRIFGVSSYDPMRKIYYHHRRRHR